MSISKGTAQVEQSKDKVKMLRWFGHVQMTTLDKECWIWRYQVRGKEEDYRDAFQI